MRDDILDAGVRVLQREGPLRFTMLTGPVNLAWSSTDGRSPRRYLPPGSRLVSIPFKVRANALRSPTNRSGSSIAAK